MKVIAMGSGSPPRVYRTHLRNVTMRRKVARVRK